MAKHLNEEILGRIPEGSAEYLKECQKIVRMNHERIWEGIPAEILEGIPRGIN